jgi:hypothetical protein
VHDCQTFLTYIWFYILNFLNRICDLAWRYRPCLRSHGSWDRIPLGWKVAAFYIKYFKNYNVIEVFALKYCVSALQCVTESQIGSKWSI